MLWQLDKEFDLYRKLYITTCHESSMKPPPSISPPPPPVFWLRKFIRPHLFKKSSLAETDVYKIKTHAVVVFATCMSY